MYKIGIDVGSTTTKVAVLKDNVLVFHKYIRHYARQRDSILSLLKEMKDIVLSEPVKLCLTGSGARIIASKTNIPFTQEVVANSLALKNEYAKVGTAIELGGQDAKIIFFRENEKGEPAVFDMRMNGSCAGGTGAFIDEIAVVLGIDVTQMNSLASMGECLYDISGRCGVFAKTDIQPLLNQGARKEDIALSCYHAIAKQTIGGLAQGLDIMSPVVFEGGPLTFHPKLIDVFATRLGLKKEDIIVPHLPEMMVAYGAALSIDEIHKNETVCILDEVIDRFERVVDNSENDGNAGKLYFENVDELNLFRKEHELKAVPEFKPAKGQIINAYLGIDSGSTTTKLVLMDEKENIIDAFYSSNEGDPLNVAKNALLSMYDKCNQAGATLNILAASSTGYGEFLFNKAFRTETHIVETVAHSLAASKYVVNPSFILDIGGQDMKAIWVEKGVITNIVVNEACSSGCGSFLENFAQTLGIRTEDIADRAFASVNLARLGSRCTVFMNSSIITEQRNGKKVDDIMAGLCRSIIENVFTKVIRVANIDSLGDRIVVQGGTFQNDAVLRAMEQYVGRKVTRAPYAGLMGAIGAALNAKECAAGKSFVKSFLDYENLKDFSFKQESNSQCPYCTNHCNRTILSFSTGDSWVTNNRCQRGEVLGNPAHADTIARIRQLNTTNNRAVNMMAERTRLVFKDYPYQLVDAEKNITIGLPRVLSFWEDMPFWSTFWKSLGYKVKMSPMSNREIYENGLHAVPSDTECFPAKLVHGHLRELAKMGVDRIFMPVIAVTPTENTEKVSFSRCALVKGYPIVIANSDDTKKLFDIPFDAPYFFWYVDEDRDRQLCEYMSREFGIDKTVCMKAISYADAAQRSFDRELKEAGGKIIEQVTAENRYAVVLAARPYHGDALVNHELPELFTKMGVPVLTVDSIPGIKDIDLSKSRLDIVNNFHARVISGSIAAAQSKHLEFVQLVSFGCGHDACLSDEAVRLMKEIGNKVPLILKVDESDAQGPIRIRVRSFIETVERKRKADSTLNARPLSDPYAVKFTEKDIKGRVLLVPNSSHAFSQIMSAAFRTQGITAIPLEVGREEAIRLGKKYTHNDICFPAQIVIGEALAALESGKYDKNHVAIGMAKYVCCCRLTHYAAALRKALDDAGYADVPIVTNDDIDYHNLHPGYRMNLKTILKILFALPMVDTLEEMLRKIRPYEKVKGSADKAFDAGMEMFSDEMGRNGVKGEIRAFKKAIKMLSSVEYDNSRRKPTVLIVGEYVLNFHPGANHDIERYLEANGFEVIEAKMTDVIQKGYFCQNQQIKELGTKRTPYERRLMSITNILTTIAVRVSDFLARHEKLHEKTVLIEDVAKESNPVIYQTFDTGEGILIPAEIIHNARKGCKNFVILQPFGCLPNHIIGRGVAKKFKEMFPDIELLALDYDPDVSFANIENRLQMLVMNRKATQE